MSYRRIIKYDYKPRLEWNRNSKSFLPSNHRVQWNQPSYKGSRLQRWLGMPILSLATILLAGMASNELWEVGIQFPPSGSLDESSKVPNLANLGFTATPQIESLSLIPPSLSTGLFPGEYAEGTDLPGESSEHVVMDAVMIPSVIDAWQEIVIKQGDNLSLIFDRLGLSDQELDEVLSLGKETKTLKSLYPEQSLRFLIQDGQLSELLYQEDPTKTLRVYKTDGGFTAETELVKPEVRVSMTTASVGSSLTLAGQEVGLSEKLMLQLIKMFGWDVDFVHEIEEGATFAILYEEYFMDGVKLRNGDVLAATFTNRGKTYKAIRYLDEDGRVDYFDGEGHDKRRAFLRTPLKFTRISSYFSPHRKHPILHRVRAHNGVDYAAPQGTPVKATGEGKIHFVGGQNGYGKTVIIDHHSNISTLYAHLSGYARGIKEGQSVRQGEIIGYVGQTGLATGPHLHYEFRVNDVHQDPLKVALPESVPSSSKAMANLKAKAEKLFAQLEQLTQTHVSSTATPSQKMVPSNHEYSLAANSEADKKSTH